MSADAAPADAAPADAAPELLLSQLTRHDDSTAAALAALHQRCVDGDHATISLVCSHAQVIGKLLESEPSLADAAAALLEYTAPTQIDAAATAGRCVFAYRNFEIEYETLNDVAAEQDLLFGNVAWPATCTLAKLLIDAPEPLPVVRGASVLEIGCGVAVAGLAASRIGAARVVLSDGEARLVDALRQRVGPDVAECSVIDWSDEAHDSGEHFDVVLGADIFHPQCRGEIHAPRLAARRLRRTRDARAVFLATVRRPETCLTAAAELERHGLSVQLHRVVDEGGAPAVAPLATAAERSLRSGFGAERFLLVVARWPD